MVRRTLILIAVGMLVLSCQKQDKMDFEKSYKYIFMGHIYDKYPIIDVRISKTKLSQFDQIWLGGDLTHDTGVKWKLDYLDSILNIKSNTTHWALGNHDIVSGREKVLNYTHKEPYYATYINGITLLVFDSNYNDQGDCKEVNEQTDFIKMVCDTLNESSHFILMGHHVPWGKIENIDAQSFANTSIDNRVFMCDTFGFFDNVIYPELVKIQQKNIQVISLAGDLGQKQSTYEYQTKDGIYFLANGDLSNNLYNEKFPKIVSNDSVLIFTHTPSKRRLEWEFIDVGN